MHVRVNQQLENRPFKPFFVCFISKKENKKILKASTPKKEILIKKTLYTSTITKINIRPGQVHCNLKMYHIQV